MVGNISNFNTLRQELRLSKRLVSKETVVLRGRAKTTTCSCFLTFKLRLKYVVSYHSASLRPRVYMGTGELLGKPDKVLGVNLRWTSIPSRGVAILLAAIQA